ncbi:MAG: hypothetical protein NTZ78_14570 [Candidatus Aureabacteria bacterium]|nr:hypothetical protein [Candidatus Auribacterota bacterium]
MTLIIFALALFAASLANAVPTNSPFPQCYNFPFSPDFGKNAELQQPGISPAKIGRIIEDHNLTWGESIGWINLRTTHADLKIGSNILAGWVWLENCGGVCVGDGSRLDGKRYSNSGTHDFGVNNDGHGKLSGFAWSEVTGWINFRTGHSRVYLDKSGQFYGYAWGENVGWMHFGPSRTVQYLAKADPGPWKEIGREEEDRLAGGPDDSEICGGSVPVTGLSNSYQRYTTDAWTVCLLRNGRDDSCAHIRCCDTPVHIASLAKLYSIRAPPVIG